MVGPVEEASSDLPFLEAGEEGIACKTGVARAGFAGFQGCADKGNRDGYRSDLDARPGLPCTPCPEPEV